MLIGKTSIKRVDSEEITLIKLSMPKIWSSGEAFRLEDVRIVPRIHRESRQNFKDKKRTGLHS